MKYTIYYPASGLIHRFGECMSAADAGAQVRPDGALVLIGEAFADDLYYIHKANGVLRPSLGFQPEYQVLADGLDEVSLLFPVNVTITFQGERHASQIALDFTTDTPGRYVFDLDPEFPYKPTTVIINAI